METADAKLPGMLERHLGPRTQVWFKCIKKEKWQRQKAGGVAESTVEHKFVRYVF